jgi:hydrogenase maturation protease
LEIIIIGYGNSLRSDDGVGQAVAKKIADLNLPNVKSIAMHQLTPELCEPLSRCDVAIFIDAHLVSEGKEVKVSSLEPVEKEPVTSHIDNPAGLLKLAKELYGNYPKAYWITVPAENFEFGEVFSPITLRGMEESFIKVQNIINSFQA